MLCCLVFGRKFGWRMLLCRFHLGMIWVTVTGPQDPPVACAVATELGTRLEVLSLPLLLLRPKPKRSQKPSPTRSRLCLPGFPPPCLPFPKLKPRLQMPEVVLHFFKGNRTSQWQDSALFALLQLGDGGGHGKGKGTKGKSKSKCSPEEIRHAAQLNAWRDSEDLPVKTQSCCTLFLLHA